MDKLPEKVTKTVCLLYTKYGSLMVASGGIKENCESGVNWVPIAELEVEFTIPENRRDPLKLTVEAIEAQIAEEKADSFRKIRGFEDELKQLLALPNGDNNGTI